MSFIPDAVNAVVDVVIYVLEVVIQITEVVISFLMALLGQTDETIIEYYEVHNVPLFDDVDEQNPQLNTLMRSVFTETDIAGDLIYALTFRSLKGDLDAFMNFIDNDKYFEGFPNVDSYILYPDYNEIVDALFQLNGVPCTPENSYVKALDATSWIQYWLQENKGYDVGVNQLGTEYRETSTDPTNTFSSVVITGSSPSFTVTITDEIATADAFLVDGRWQVDFATIEYHSATDDYTVQVYNAEGTYITLPYHIPNKPLQIHYIVYYYIDSAPSRQYIFVYLVGEGTYPELDNPQNEINIDGTQLRAVPAIPLRISNVSYPSFAGDKPQQIEDLCKVVNIDAAAVLDAIMTDPDTVPGDLDHIYINFGIRMWDTSQTGMAYLYRMFQNLYPTQGVTQGIYDDTVPGDTKPANNIIITTEDYRYVFQWSYITFEHTTLAEIDADTGSPENGIYYSDMSRFNDAGILVYPYHSSSGKGTYNVGYKADTLDEVADFLLGNGVVNPGDTTGEATDWLQTTVRMRYTEVLQDPDGSVSSILFLTPDRVYENVGGILRAVVAASEPTTFGQSITYYYCTPSGLNAYTVAAPIGTLKVEDGDTGHFRMVKFNLGNKNELMVPFIHNFIADLSNRNVSQLFLAGSHASIYIAHYEVIEQSGFGFLLMIIIIIIIIVITIVTWGSGTAPSAGLLAPTQTATGLTAIGGPISGPAVIGANGIVTVNGVTVVSGTLSSSAALTGIVSTAAISGGVMGTLAVAWVPTLVGWATSFAVSQIIKLAVTAIAKKSPALAAVFAVVATVAAGSIGSVGGTYQFRLPGFGDIAKIFAGLADHISSIIDVYVAGEYDALEEESTAFQLGIDAKVDELEEIKKGLYLRPTEGAYAFLGTVRRVRFNPTQPEALMAMYDNYYDIQYLPYSYGSNIDVAIDPPGMFE